jgi:hypothetical protein
MRLPRLSPSVERPKPGTTDAAPPRTEIRPQTMRTVDGCTYSCGPGGRCPAQCPNCVNGMCQQ